MLACLRAVGLSQAQVPWQSSLAAFAFIRLLDRPAHHPRRPGDHRAGPVRESWPPTPGHKAGVQVTAAVLMYRAVTYLPPIPLGALACLTWRLAPALLRARPARPACTAMTAPASLRQIAAPDEAGTL